jgi:2-polyprenyl-3-methyl-5-hydroxy-6-metoxy-1,4-benzoquinol methylase
MKKKWTGERLETFIYNRDSIEHLHRYAIASNYINDKIVLDIASGEGYGSNIMSKKASFVYGVDIDNEAVQEAKVKYNRENLEFLTGSTSQIPLDDNSIDVVVSFETIEHHEHHDEMMYEIKRVLKPNGILIISTPDKLFYSDERNYNNLFHLKELYKQEFVDLMLKNFNKMQLLTQKYINGNSVIEDDTINSKMQIFSGNYEGVNDEVVNPLYLIAIASSNSFQLQISSVFDGNQITLIDFSTQMSTQMNHIYSSNSYKIGHFFLLPLKKIKKLFK